MSEADIPIDIAVRKLLDWLVSRRQVDKDWHKQLLSIRAKVGEAMKDMPEHHEIKELLSGTSINYFHCLKIVEVLKETEADSKNFFGSYGSQRMKDWTDIIRDYQSGSVYLAEAAQVLSQLVAYEGPSLRKVITRADQMEVECERKAEASLKREKEVREEYRKECASLGLKGENIRKEIIQLAVDLPQVYQNIAEDVKELSETCRYYQEFINDTFDEGLEEKVLENLAYLIEAGNVTTYEWKYREKPISVEEVKFDVEEDNSDDEGTGIDFGDGEKDFGDGGDIDFGDGAEIDFGDGGEIDFGDSNEEYFGGEEIDFGNLETVDITIEDGGHSGGIAKDEEALSILDNRRSRTLIIDDLEELDGFLSQRISEMETNAESRFSFLQSAKGTLGKDVLEKYFETVRRVIGKFREPSLLQLQLIRSSPAVVDRLVQRLKNKSSLVDKVISGRSDIVERRLNAEGERTCSVDKLGILDKQVKELQLKVEEDVSKRYKGRKVHLMGVTV